MPEDYVPEETSGYNYAASPDDMPKGAWKDENPLGSTTNSAGDDEGFTTTNFRPDATPEEIAKGSFRYIGPGTHVVYVKDIQWADDGRPIPEKVYVKQPNGTVRPMNMDCRKCKVIFAIPGDENLTISDMFLLPPAESQLEAYEYGWKEQKQANDNPREKGGFHAKKLRHFLGRLAFEFDSQGRIPLAATKFSNWKKYPGTNIHKQVKFEVRTGQAGKPYTDKKTGEQKVGQGFNNIVMFSYCSVPIPAEVEVARKAAEIARNRELAQSIAKVQPEAQEPTQEPVETPEEKPVKKTKKVTAQA